MRVLFHDAIHASVNPLPLCKIRVNSRYHYMLHTLRYICILYVCNAPIYVGIVRIAQHFTYTCTYQYAFITGISLRWVKNFAIREK